MQKSEGKSEPRSRLNWDPTYKPRLRPVEAFPVRGKGGMSVGLVDPSGFSEAALTLSHAALGVLALMDGQTTCDQIRISFQQQFGQALSIETLHSVLDYLDQALLLDNARFSEQYGLRLSAYRRAGVRKVRDAASLGVIDSSGDLFRDMLEGFPRSTHADQVVGVIAPHLDYPRGRPCYAAAYACLVGRRPPDRVVILGTNHIGRSSLPVTTSSVFETPLGTTRVDADFIVALEQRVGGLREFELDHLREHSIELQVLWLQHLFGADAFQLVPILCPDPCGSGEPVVGHLRELAAAIRELVDGDSADTLIVAGADLSHIGGYFGDDQALEAGFLAEVERADRSALGMLELSEPHSFVSRVADCGNDTRICSVGCMFTLAAALPDARPVLLDYHQAVDESLQNCVTCAAVVYHRQ